MKKTLLFLTNILLLSASYGQGTRALGCGNLNFGSGNLSGWTLTTSTACNSSFACYTLPSTLVLSSPRHVLINSSTPDPDVPSIDGFCPITGNNSVRLGSFTTGNGAEEMTYKLQIGVTQDLIKLHYAYITNDSFIHKPNSNPFFYVEILDSLENPFIPAKNFYIASNDSSLISQGSWRYKNWSSVSFNVASLHGQSVKIRVLNSNCFFGSHLGRAYFDFECNFKTTSLNNILNKDAFTLYPNPTNEKINITVKNQGAIEIYSITGNLVQANKITKGNTVLNIKSFNKGMYFVKYTSITGKTITKKIQVIN